MAQRHQHTVGQRLWIQIIGLTTFAVLFVGIDHLTGWIGVFN